jgi:hypothetical protein
MLRNSGTMPLEDETVGCYCQHAVDVGPASAIFEAPECPLYASPWELAACVSMMIWMNLPGVSIN